MKIQSRYYERGTLRSSCEYMSNSEEQAFALTASDGAMISQRVEDEFGNESIHTIILERDEFEELKKL